MTTSFVLKTFFDTFFNSYQSQCACFFNQYAMNRYGKMIQLRIQYYQPSRISAELSLIHIRGLNTVLQSDKTKGMALRKTQGVKGMKLQTEMSRITSPSIDSYILAQFFAHMADKYNFRQICYQIEGKIIYRIFKNALIGSNHMRKEPLRSKDQVLGIEISLHGRIPREAVRPRKTVQTQILGRGSKRFVNKNKFLTNRFEKINPELGTFSIWIRQVV